MTISLTPLKNEYTAEFKRDIQEAFQYGFESEFGKCDETILPEKDIDNSLNSEGAEAYLVLDNGIPCGGVAIRIDADGKHGHLDLLYVKVDHQNSGIGCTIWTSIEKMHPEIEVWETCTPYFDKRNIHFYVNRCGFRIVEFFNEHHHDPNSPDGVGGMPPGQSDNFFVFEKTIGKER